MQVVALTIAQRYAAAGFSAAVQLSSRSVVLTVRGSVSRELADLLGRVAQLRFYDWEGDVLGPDGRPQPLAASITGGQNAGNAAAGISEYEALLRAASAQRRPVGGASRWYLLDLHAHRVLAGPASARAALNAAMAHPPAAARAVRVSPGIAIVQALPTQQGYVDSWYVLNDQPVLSNDAIRNPMQSFDSGPGGTGEPVVIFDFSPAAQGTFEQVTRQLAQRGLRAQLPGSSPSPYFQHFAIALDDQLISVPYVDFTTNPNGIDASIGSQLQGGFTLPFTRGLAADLHTGPIPSALHVATLASR
jgi:SecD/SecF fusion protein